MCPAVFAAEDSAFGEYCQSLQWCGPVAADDGIGQDPVVKSEVNAVMMTVKSYRFHVNICGDEFCTADLGVGCRIQNSLGTGG
jgi:hypothetical protein